MILVSSCLLGNNVKYSGGNNLNELLAEYSRYLTPVCPEVLGGLMTPRQPAEIQGGDVQSVLAGQAKVMDKAGADVTSAFVKGAEAVLELVKDHKVRVAILKANSPSCGNKEIYHHPNKNVVGSLQHLGAKVLTTFDHGNIVVTTDGKEFKVSTER